MILNTELLSCLVRLCPRDARLAQSLLPPISIGPTQLRSGSSGASPLTHGAKGFPALHLSMEQELSHLS